MQIESSIHICEGGQLLLGLQVLEQQISTKIGPRQLGTLSHAFKCWIGSGPNQPFMSTCTYHPTPVPLIKALCVAHGIMCPEYTANIHAQTPQHLPW